MFDRTRWSALGAVLAVTLAAGAGLPGAQATNTAGGGSGVVFVPVVPCRLFDTRNGPSNVGPRSAALAAGETFTQSVTGSNGNCSIPAAASAVAMNVTTVNATATSYLTVWPADADQPLASNLNWTAGAPATPNKVDVKLSADGKIKLFNNGGTVDVLADIVGYYAGHDHDDRYYTKPEVAASLAAVQTNVDAVAASVGSLAASRPGTMHSDVYDRSAMVFADYVSYVSTSTPGGCTGYGSAMSIVQGTVPLVLPVGARVETVDVATYEAAGAPFYIVALKKHVLGAAAMTTVEVTSASVSHVGPTAIAHHSLTPPTTEIVEPGESFFLTVDLRGANLDAFCSATVTYDTAG